MSTTRGRVYTRSFGDVIFKLDNFSRSNAIYFQDLLRISLSRRNKRTPQLIATGTKNKLVYLWDAQDRNILMIVDTDIPTAACLILNDNILVTTGKNLSLKVFRIPTGTLISVLYGHLRNIYAMTRVRGDIMVTGSMDNSARVWDIGKGLCMHVLNGHTGAVCCLQRIDDVRVASGGEDKLILIWDVEKGTCLKMFQEHREMVYCMAMVGEDRLVSGGFDNIRVWNMNTYTFIHQFSAGDHYDMCTMEHDEIAVSHSGSFISVWNVTTTVSNNPYYMNAIKLGYIGKNRIVAGGNFGFSVIHINGNEVEVEKIKDFDEKITCMSVY